MFYFELSSEPDWDTQSSLLLPILLLADIAHTIYFIILHFLTKKKKSFIIIFPHIDFYFKKKKTQKIIQPSRDR